MSKRLFDSLALSSDNNRFSRFRPPPCSASSVRLFRMVSIRYGSIKLRLETFAFASCPEYIALSYTWDPRPRYMHDPENPKQNLTDPNEALDPDFVSVPVEINGCSYMISRHLAGGLHALDRFSKGKQEMPVSEPLSTSIPDPMWIFADAICICQNDNDDKATQIANMHKVFGQAKTVFMWLGRALYDIPVGKTGKQGVQVGECLYQIPSLIKEMKDCLERSKTLAQSSLESVQQPRDFWELPSLKHTNSRLWSCLHCFASIPWWERLWVVQEVALAQKAVIMCSRYALPWATYVKFLKLSNELHLVPGLLAHLPKSFRIKFSRTHNGRALAIDQLSTLMSEAREKVSQDQIKVLLGVVRKSFVLQPLDRVYAVLGLLGSAVRERVHIDYSDAARKNYRLKWIEVCQIIIATDPSLASSLFLHASWLTPKEGIPSWCPNLEDNESILDDGIQRTSYVAGMLESPITGERSATHISEVVPKVMPIPGTTAISASGIRIDQIAYTEDFSWITDVLESDSDTIGEKKSLLSVLVLEALSRCTQALKDAMPSAQNHDLIIARCLVGDQHESKPPNDLAQDYQAFKDWLRDNCDQPATRSDGDVIFFADFPPYGGRFLYFAAHCSFFITEFGRPGVMTRKVVEGDHVCLIMGLGTPYVLRENKSNSYKSFELVGEAYVDGIMNGEATSSLGKIDERIEEFRIE